ncbi:MAG: hypothetical protein ACXABY_01315 [Candidatus Thorarchaeota archaeon]|jgi:hypothetical protein
MRFDKFFLLPDGSVEDVGSSHWKWISKYTGKYREVMERSMVKGSMLPLFEEGWWRGDLSIGRLSGKLVIAFQTYPHPSKRKLIDRVMDVMSAMGLRKGQVEGVEIETDMKGQHKFNAYEIHELFEETSFINMAKLLAEGRAAVDEILSRLEKS